MLHERTGTGHKGTLDIYTLIKTCIFTENGREGLCHIRTGMSDLTYL